MTAKATHKGIIVPTYSHLLPIVIFHRISNSWPSSCYAMQAHWSKALWKYYSKYMIFPLPCLSAASLLHPVNKHMFEDLVIVLRLFIELYLKSSRAVSLYSKNDSDFPSSAEALKL